MRTCLLVFLIIIWLPIAAFSIWTTNFYLKTSKADFWLKNFNEIEGPQRLSQAVPDILSLALKGGPDPRMIKILQAIAEKATTPQKLNQQISQLLSGGEAFLKGKNALLPGLNLKDLRQSILNEPSLPPELKQPLLKDIPENLTFSSQISNKASGFAKTSRYSWLGGLIVSLVFLLLIILAAEGSRGKLLAVGISLILLSGLILSGLLIFSLINGAIDSQIKTLALPVPGLKEMLRDFASQILKELRNLVWLEGLIGLLLGIGLFVASLFLPKKQPSPKPIATPQN